MILSIRRSLLSGAFMLSLSHLAACGSPPKPERASYWGAGPTSMHCINLVDPNVPPEHREWSRQTLQARGHQCYDSKNPHARAYYDMQIADRERTRRAIASGNAPQTGSVTVVVEGQYRECWRYGQNINCY